MGKVIMSGIVPQKVAPVTFKSNFSDNTWEQIIEACQKNKVPDTWTVGSQKTMTINGTDYTIDIIGKNHDDYADGSGKAPLTFQMHDCYGTTYGMNSSYTNTGSWKDCLMRNTNLPAILALMPSEVQAGIKEVNKLTWEGKWGNVGSNSIVTTADKLFLPSEIEVFGSVTYSAAGEGSQYAYYSAGNSKQKNANGTTAQNWLLRSPRGTTNTEWCCVNMYSGAYYIRCSTSATWWVAPAFCF